MIGIKPPKTPVSPIGGQFKLKSSLKPFRGFGGKTLKEPKPRDLGRHGAIRISHKY